MIDVSATSVSSASDGASGFNSMEAATATQLARYFAEGGAHYRSNMIPNLVTLLELGKGADFGAGVDRYVHSLQTATRAYRSNARVDMVVGALLHDVADGFALMNHSAVAAAILEKYVDEETTWVIQHHTVFQGFHFWDKIGEDRYSREAWAGNAYFDSTANFCAEWDQCSFNPNYDTLPIEFFIPALEEVFSREVDGLVASHSA